MSRPQLHVSMLNTLADCACGAPEWNDTGQCEECWTEDEQAERPEEADSKSVYYNICDR